MLRLPPLFLPSSARLLVSDSGQRGRKKNKKKNKVTSFTGYQLGWFGDVLRRILDSQPQLQTGKWCERPISPVARLLGFLSAVAPDPLWLHGSRATGAAVLCCSISAQFPGIAQFSTHCLVSFLAALHLLQARCALTVPSHRYSHRSGTSQRPFALKSETLYKKGKHMLKSCMLIRRVN